MASAPEKYDLVVVGGGKAGKSLAMLRAKKGDKVFMVERDKIGGTCINVACIPTKTLVSSARRLAEVRTAAAYGVDLPGADLPSAGADLGALRARKARVVWALGGGPNQTFAAPGTAFCLGPPQLCRP